MNDLKTKRCPRCGTTKPRDQFRQRVLAGGVPSGLRAYCIPCEADYTRQRRPAANAAQQARLSAAPSDHPCLTCTHTRHCAATRDTCLAYRQHLANGSRLLSARWRTPSLLAGAVG